MALSPIEVGALLDRWADKAGIGITETHSAVTISNLGTEQAIELTGELAESWTIELLDGATQPIAAGELNDHFGPYIAILPKLQSAETRILTSVGLRQALERVTESCVWQVACCSQKFSTGLIEICPWGSGDIFSAATETKSPLALVRESSEQRLTPPDIRLWALRSSMSEQLWADRAFQTYARSACSPLLRSIATEVIGRRAVVFSGPPRVTVSFEEMKMLDGLGQTGFSQLQAAVAWIYEDHKSAEQRHGIYSSEVGRSAKRDESIEDVLSSAGKVILESARLAYQLSQSDISREAIKAQGDLRKAIADDTSKVADSTRSLTTAITVAVVTGIGSVAAKATSTGSPLILSIITAIVAIYLLGVTAAGWQHLNLQRALRQEWRQRLYRFIPDDDYKAMVLNPASAAERPYHVMGVIAVLVSLSLLVVAAISWPSPTHPQTINQLYENVSDI